MKTHIISIVVVIIAALSPLSAQQPATKKPPVGVPADATLFDGNWYRIYLDRTDWTDAKQKCERLGGHLVVVHDQPTHVYIRELADNRHLWLGGFKKTEGLWEWVDGSPFKFKGWGPNQPDAGLGFKAFHTWRGGWGDTDPKDRGVIGFICQWKAK